jgi:PIN domain nuclease of toxin-antitoxin system
MYVFTNDWFSGLYAARTAVALHLSAVVYDLRFKCNVDRIKLGRALDAIDRLLVAQALTEPMRLVTHDAQVARYSDTVIVI